MGEIDEAELVSAGQQGAVIDGMADGGQRTVQAAVLRRCCHELKDRIDPRGLRLTNVVVVGGLDLSGLVVPFSLRFEGCEFDAAPVVEGAQPATRRSRRLTPTPAATARSDASARCCTPSTPWSR
jgi:hypothetical protein